MLYIYHASSKLNAPAVCHEFKPGTVYLSQAALLRVDKEESERNLGKHLSEVWGNLKLVAPQVRLEQRQVPIRASVAARGWITLWIHLRENGLICGTGGSELSRWCHERKM